MSCDRLSVLRAGSEDTLSFFDLGNGLNSFDCSRGSPRMGARETSPQPKLARVERSGRESRRVVMFNREKNFYGKLEARRSHSAN